MVGKKALVEMLLAEGVEHIFGNPGTSETPFMDALQDYPQVKYITSLQEASAVGMADGYARATGRPSFANLHIAGGLANGISMLYDAYKGGTPLVLTAGNSDTRMLLTDPVLSGDLVEMTRQYTKWSAEINHPSDIPMVVRRAFKEAKTPPTGPVFVAFPWNTLDDEADVEIVPSSPGYFRIRPDADAVARASALLSGAESPIMVVGDRVAQSGAAREAVEVAELTGARVYAASYTEMNFPTSHPQFLGGLNLNRGSTKDLFADADVVLAVGANVFQSFLYVADPFLGPNSALIHLDSATQEIEKVYPTRVGMTADPKAGLADLCDALETQMSGSQKEAAKTRAATIGDEKQKGRESLRRRAEASWDKDPMSVDRMMAEMAKALPADTVIADESVTSRGAMLGAMDFDEPGCMHAIQGGGLGWAMGGALGIKLAHPDRPVVAVVGDGASLYTIQALWTAARYNIPVTYVICNNRTYRILKQNMDIYLRDMLEDKDRVSDYVGMDFPLPLDVAGIARGFGVNGVQVTKPEDVGPAMEKALASGTPQVVDVVIDSAPYPWPAPAR
jgi:benzoylformate decarboxylase